MIDSFETWMTTLAFSRLYLLQRILCINVINLACALIYEISISLYRASCISYLYGRMTDSPQSRDKPSRELIEELCLRFVVNKPLEDTK